MSWGKFIATAGLFGAYDNSIRHHKNTQNFHGN